MAETVELSPWTGHVGPQPPAQSGRDCPSCVHSRERHGSHGCICGCALSIALVTRSLYRRTS